MQLLLTSSSQQAGGTVTSAARVNDPGLPETADQLKLGQTWN